MVTPTWTVADFMTPVLCTTEASTPLEQVYATMDAHKYGCAVVRDCNQAVGMFTTTDALRAVRALVTGKQVERLTLATHADHTAQSDPIVRHGVRAADFVAGMGAHSGMLGGVR